MTELQSFVPWQSPSRCWGLRQCCVHLSAGTAVFPAQLCCPTPLAQGAADEDAFEQTWEGLKTFDTSMWTVYFQNVKQLCERDYPEGYFPVVLTFLCEWLIPTWAWGEETKEAFSLCHQASSGLCTSKAINSSLWHCRWLCHPHLLGHFSRQRIFHAPFHEPLWWYRHFSAVCPPGVWLPVHLVHVLSQTPCLDFGKEDSNSWEQRWIVTFGHWCAAGDEDRRASHGCLSCWEFSNPLTQLIDDSLEKQPHSSPTLPVKGVFHWGI